MKAKTLKILALTLLFLAFANQTFAQEGVVTIDQDSDITKLLEYKKDVKTLDLYKIQLDFGSRSEAMALEREFKNTFSQWPTDVVYETPNYKVWVGNFSTRLEADIALLKIKKKFSKAMVFEPKKDN
ncbi:SPOR domain-containing protein [Psychroserpens algicola]|uniref:SPOR domain-containing protein n=1 Tax=Psychroserpens algicola TaxID=1719034 RepID=A0ABT0HC36_9FLAO|nr:SPOR domain-containing protein [Psychroserpens algicola]MCK8481907.1 SPOR domain-containing protein [Psychroserpens algicola]